MRPETKPDVVGDWNHLAELFGPDSFDVVVWDPPHITDAGRGLTGDGSWADRYGTAASPVCGRSVSVISSRHSSRRPEWCSCRGMER